MRIPAIAARLEISETTWRSYVSRGQAPEPDGYIDGRTPFWHEDTIDQYAATKRGRGWWRDDPAVQRAPQRPRRTFSPEFKAQVVAQCRRGDRSIAQVADEHDLTVSAVRAWVRAAEANR